MIGAIIGDIAGSRFERHNHRSKDFDLFTHESRFTDDSVMSLAVADAILASGDAFENLPEQTVRAMQSYGRQYRHRGYGGMFREWLKQDDPKPYGSFGNGGAMRVSAVGWAASSLEEAQDLARQVTEVTHNHPEAIKSAEAVASAVYLARMGASIDDIRAYLQQNYYPLDFTLDDIRDTYVFDVSAQGSVPQAIEAFLESESFEDAIRGAVSIGGDSDTIAAIAGSIAEAYYGVPDDLRARAESMLRERLRSTLHRFEEKYGKRTTSDTGGVTFEEAVAMLDQDTIDEIAETRDIMVDFEDQIREGMHEALDYALDAAFEKTLTPNLRELYLTFHHLLAEPEPEEDEEETDEMSGLGIMMTEANMDATLAMTMLLAQQSEDLERGISEIVSDAIDGYMNYDFGSSDNDTADVELVEEDLDIYVSED